jgi:hypothetical protein
MSPLIKTNPAFAHLAYRRAVIVQLVQDLRDNYMQLSDPEPKRTIVSDDVFRDEATVPQEELVSVMQEMELEAENIRLEMLKFTFTRKETDGFLSSEKRETGGEVRDEQGAPQGRRKRRRGR